MKTFIALPFIVLTTSLLITGNSYASEVCRTFESDPDGDGWGWENDASCRVTQETGRIPEMNHPRTGQRINLERIFWVWDDFNNRTIGECQGYIVDPNQARDICSTCQTPAASLFHGPFGAGVYTLPGDEPQFTEVTARQAATPVGVNKAAASQTDIAAFAGVSVVKNGLGDSNLLAMDSQETDAEIDTDAEDTGCSVVDATAEMSDDQVAGDTQNHAECDADDAEQNEAEDSTDGNGEDASNSAANAIVDNNAQGVSDGSTDVASNSNGAEADTNVNTAAASNNTNSANDTTVVVNNNAEVNTTTQVAEIDANGLLQVSDAGGMVAVQQATQLQATFDWNVDNSGVYFGALAIDFYGELTPAGVRFWEDSDAGRTGFYTLCEVLPSTMQQPVATGSTTNNQDAAACIDIDGDGWGWDGEASCIP